MFGGGRGRHGPGPHGPGPHCRPRHHHGHHCGRRCQDDGKPADDKKADATETGENAQPEQQERSAASMYADEFLKTVGDQVAALLDPLGKNYFFTALSVKSSNKDGGTRRQRAPINVASNVVRTNTPSFDTANARTNGDPQANMLISHR